MIEKLLKQCSDLASSLNLDKNISINSYMAQKHGDPKYVSYFKISIKDSYKKNFEFMPSPYGPPTVCEAGDFSLEEALIKIKDKLIYLTKLELERLSRRNANLTLTLSKLEIKQDENINA
jgi:hypothetical protein